MAWWLSLFPGVAILITVLSRKEEFFFVSEGSPEGVGVRRKTDDTNPAYSRSPAGIFLMLAVITALLSVNELLI